MSLLDAWIFALPAQWGALETADGDGNPVPFSYAHSNAVTGYWKDSGPYRVYNVWGSEADIQAIVDALDDVQHVFAWGQDADRFDSLDKWPTDPAVILSVMKDHVTYDENGDVASTTPATLDNPNWGHVYQTRNLKQRIFAGDFGADFTEEFY